MSSDEFERELERLHKLTKRKRKLEIKKNLIWMRICIAILIIAGSVIIYFCNVKPAIMNYQAKSGWIKVPCKIVSLELENKTYLSRGTKGKPDRYVESYNITGEFSYEYTGESYLSSCFNFQQWLNSKALFEKRLVKYYDKPDLNCYVNPENPQEAVLDAELTPYYMIYTLVGTVLLGLSVLLTKKYRQYKSTNTNQEDSNFSDIV